MAQNIEIGKFGEDLAAKYLLNKKYKIIERNYWKPWGELDIIAKDKSGILVFVEVKTLKENAESFLKPEDNLTKSKLEKVKRTALLYAGSHENLLNEKLGWRIDLIAMTVKGDLTGLSNNGSINHWENIA